MQPSAAAGPELALWTAFRSADTPEAARVIRDQLILQYSPLVKFVAGRVASGLPSSVDSADLVSYGIFGLIDAIEKFDHERGHRFESYAMARVRGSIVDGLRSLDWVPRTVRSKAREIERAFQKLEGDHGRSPTDAELADELGVTLPQLHATLSRISRSGVTTLDPTLADEGLTSVADDSGQPGDDLMAAENRRDLLGSVMSLPDRERKVLTLYYFEGLNMADIGQVIGVSESRVCQIHAKAVLHLRSRLLAADED
jgi:RNA polymerase sigma factor FliA